MKKILKIFAPICFVGVVAQAYPPMKSDQLLGLFQSEDKTSGFFLATAYIQGVANSNNYTMDYCIPNNIQNTNHIGLEIKKALETQTAYPYADDLIVNTLSKLYPCKLEMFQGVKFQALSCDKKLEVTSKVYAKTLYNGGDMSKEIQKSVEFGSLNTGCSYTK